MSMFNYFLYVNESVPTCAGMVMPSRDYLGLSGDCMVLGQVVM